MVSVLSSYYEKFLATGEMKCIDEEIPFEIPATWEWVRGKSVFLPMESTKPAKDFVYIDVDAVNNKTNSIDKPKFILKTNAPSRATRKLHKNDILFSMVRPYLRNIALVPEEYANAIASTGFYVITSLNALFPKYIFLLMLSSYVVDGLNSFMKGENSPSINNCHIEDFLYPLPPLTEQHRIVAKVEELLPFVENYACAQNKLNKLNTEINDKLKKSILQEAIQGRLVPQIAEEGTVQELFEQIKQEKARLVKEGKLKKSVLSDSNIFRGDDNKYYEQIGKKCLDITEQITFEIPVNWAWARMGQIGDWGAGSTPQRGNANYYNGNILWLKTGELNNGIVYDTEEKITQKAFQDCSLRMNKIGDVLIAMYGATIGKLAIVGKDLTTNQACCGCTPYLIYNWYLFYFLMASRDSFIKKGEGGAQPNISRVKLVEHLIPLPPLKEQHRIVAQIEKLFEQLR